MTVAWPPSTASMKAKQDDKAYGRVKQRGAERDDGEN